MISFITKNNILYKRQEIWFYNGEEIPLFDNNIFYQAKLSPHDIKIYSEHSFYTSCIDLTLNEEEIFKNVDPNFRNEIRKAEKEKCTFNTIDSPSLKDLSEYLFLYGQFCKIKKLLPPDKARTQALFSFKNFIITKIIYNQYDVITHTYIHDKERVRLLNSYHDINFLDNKLRGYFNKYLHWKDILFFKSKGFSIYDFGGIDKVDRSGISGFKKSFGGYDEKSIDFTIVSGLYKQIRRLF